LKVGGDDRVGEAEIEEEAANIGRAGSGVED
jgi:hypothetical protein